MPTLHPFEKRIVEAEKLNIEVYEIDFESNAKGLYVDGVIAINRNLSWTEKNCVLAEEIGHAILNCGDITNQNISLNRKQERQGRNYAYQRLVSLDGFIRAYKHGCCNLFEVAEYLDVTEGFLMETIRYYLRRYGLSIIYEGYEIRFNENGVRIERG